MKTEGCNQNHANTIRKKIFEDMDEEELYRPENNADYRNANTIRKKIFEDMDEEKLYRLENNVGYRNLSKRSKEE